jgi:putative ABC transport system permease protein
VGWLRRRLAAACCVATVLSALTTMFMTPENASAIGGPATLAGAIAIALVGPRVMTRVAEYADRRAPALAVLNLHARAASFAAVLVPIVLASAIALANIYSQTTEDRAARDARVAPLAADAVVTSRDGIAPALAARVRATPGVTGASALVSSHGWIVRPYDSRHTSDPLALLGVEPGGYDGVRAPAGDAVALPDGLAEHLGVGIGDRIGMRLGDDAPVSLRVSSLFDGPRGYDTALLPAALLARHTTAGLPSHLLVRGDASHVSLAGWPGASLHGREALASAVDPGLELQGWINYLVAAVALAYAAIATANTLAVAVLARRRELGLLRLAGATRRDVRRLLYAEGGVVVVAGLVLGTAVSLFTLVPTAIACGRLLPAGPPWVFAGVAALLAGLVLGVTAVASRVALRPTPFETPA